MKAVSVGAAGVGAVALSSCQVTGAFRKPIAGMGASHWQGSKSQADSCL